MNCKRCGAPTVYTSGICGHCQRPDEQSKKASERPKRKAGAAGRSPHNEMHRQAMNAAAWREAK